MERIYLKGNYIIIVKQGKEVPVPKTSRYYENTDSFELQVLRGRVETIPFSQIGGIKNSETGDEFYTNTSLRTFLQDNSGFNAASGGSGAGLQYSGVIDYGDTSTTTTPIEINSGAGNLSTWVDIPNDGLGPFSINTVDGVTNIMDTTTGQYDFNELSVGDKVDLRIDLDITTTAPNGTVTVRLLLGGDHAGAFPLTFASRFYSAATSNDSYVFSTEVDFQSAFLLTNNSKLQIMSDKGATIINNGVRNWLHVA